MYFVVVVVVVAVVIVVVLVVVVVFEPWLNAPGTTHSWMRRLRVHLFSLRL